MQFFVDENVLPQTLSLLQTRSQPLGIELVVGDVTSAAFSPEFYGALIQIPGQAWKYS